jgi:C-3',4' desaturase CrtD
MSKTVKQKKVVVIGAGIGGLTAGALLLKVGFDVTVLEAHVYPGGSAGTFYHKGFRFDAGATLAGGFAAGGPHARLAESLGLTWPVKAVDPAWLVHLQDGRLVTQGASAEKWQAERQRVFPGTESFWRKQAMLANAAWDVSSRPFPWPPQSPKDLLTLAQAVRPQTVSVLPYLQRSIQDIAPQNDTMFTAFLDAQLLIAAQTTSAQANALYGSAALDLPRRGVNYVCGGMGALAETLVSWIRTNGGEVLFRQQVEKIEVKGGRATAVISNKGLYMAADIILGNLTPWALQRLLGDHAPDSLTKELRQRQATWGAFTLYLGLDTAKLAPDLVDHHQVIVDHTQPLGEGNSVFISLSDAADTGRAPTEMRTATLSTHTAVAPWWQLRNENSKQAYEARRQQYAAKLISVAERAIPNLGQAVTLCKPGTPVTFEFYTRRPYGMVGGFPQTSLFKARGPQTGIANLWLVGDSIFPGQSTAGVTLGGMRVATAVKQAHAPYKTQLYQLNKNSRSQPI